MEERMRILVTGGAGFIGSFLVERLLSNGYSVSILDNIEAQVHPFGTPPHLPSAAKFYLGNILDRDMLSSALKDIDVVVHCAGAVGIAQSLYQVDHYVGVNVGGTANLLQVLIERKRLPKKLVILSSMTVYGEGVYRRPSDGRLLRVGIRSRQDTELFGWEPVCAETGEVLEAVATPEDATPLAQNIYALSKRYQEELALSIGHTYGFPVVCLRLFNVYGPRQSLANPYTGVLAIFLSRLLRGNRPVTYEDGKQTRDFVSVHDVVNAVMLAIERSDANGQVINIGSGVPRRIGDVAQILASLMDREHVHPEITGHFRKGDVRHCYADIVKAQWLLGFEPRVRWEEGLIEVIDWARHALASDRFDEADKELRDHGLLAT
jgi:dTDP-L-rhamnose 4-epimerase